ncbi:DUF4123 domain-containing protein [Litoreibacter meonggei]|uniref:DUF4123 domain-containing protein n=1 Tax=Litoreibacter meonggei TaxID=1049199 RepID=UPI0014741F22|nr:DUF4123 domain-containing protein [Litoreibacter meonggei]
MNTEFNEHDYWTQTGGATSSPEDGPERLWIKTIADIEPLGDQFGVTVPQSSPAQLRQALFGHPEGRADDAPFYTYALLDGAKLVGLPEILEESGLECASLFQGAAEEDLRDVAPWIVRLDEKSRLTRGLFTRGNAAHHLWDAEPGLYLRSKQSLTGIRNQLRKFTRLRSEADKWYFFRFWEPFYFHVYSDRMARFPNLEALWLKTFAGMDVLVPRVTTSSAIHIQVQELKRKDPTLIDTKLRAELKLSVLYRNMIGAAEDLFELHEDEARRYGESPADLWPLLYDFADEVRAVGLTDPELRGRMMLLAFLKFHQPWPAFLDLPFWQKIRQSPGQANDLFEDFCARLKYQSGRAEADLEVWW